MPGVFNSAPFFKSAFFEPTATTSDTGESGDGILIDGLDPRKAGELANRPGHWGTLYLKVYDFPSKPTPQREYTVDGSVWRVDTASQQGDIWECYVLQTQRISK